MKLVLVVLDGAADRATPQTPYQAAHTPVLDHLADEGATGVHYPLKPGVPVGSGIAHFRLFGYEKNYPGRGYMEALGAGIDVKEEYYYFRINFATVKPDYTVVDRRAGRNEKFLDEFADYLTEKLADNPFNRHVRVCHTEGHRGVLEVELDNCVGSMDPKETGKPVRFLHGGSEDERFLNYIVKTSHRLLSSHPLNRSRDPPANIILPRACGRKTEIQEFGAKWGLKAVGVADRSLYLGAAGAVGMDMVRLPDEEKVIWVLRNPQYDFYFIHFKKTDIYGHDGDFHGKVQALEKVDSLLEPLLDLNAVICVTSDHATPVSLRDHSGDPVPFLIHGADSDPVDRFDEFSVSRGRYGTVNAMDVLPLMLNAAGLYPEVDI